MMRGGIPIGKVFGIQLRLHYSWFIVFALVTWSLAASYFPATYPGWSLATRIITGLITSLLFFASVMAHELMHSVVSQKQGIPVRAITLFIFGGVSEITDEPKRAGDEFRMALAGPLTSLVIGAVCWGIWYLTRDTVGYVAAVAYWLGWINIYLAVFNLIPGFPLDGGRVLRSLIWGRSGNLRKATKTASTIGRVIGYLFIFGGIVLVFTGSLFDGLWLAFIGWFLENAAAGSYRQLAFRYMLQGHTVSEVMVRDCQLVRPEMTVESLVNEQMLASGRRCFPVVADGRLLGLVTLHNIKSLPRAQWAAKTVAEAMTPFDKLKKVGPNDDLASVLAVLTGDDINQVPVIEGESIVGVLSRDKLLAFLSVRGELGL
jgi:Zn-dependent protease